MKILNKNNESQQLLEVKVYRKETEREGGIQQARSNMKMHISACLTLEYITINGQQHMNKRNDTLDVNVTAIGDISQVKNQRSINHINSN